MTRRADALRMSEFFDWSVLFNALTLGAVYALIAVGYTMVYGIIQLINFAHGEVFMIGTFAGLLLFAQLSVPLSLAILLAMLVCLMLGVVIDFTAYLPLRRKHPLADTISIAGLTGFCGLAIAYFLLARAEQSQAAASGLRIALGVLLAAIPLALFALAICGLYGKLGRPKASVTSDRLSALITAIGMSLSLQTIAQLVWGADFYVFPPFAKESLAHTVFESDVLTLGSATLKGKEFVIWVVTAALMVGLNGLVHRTKIGKAMRACAQDQKTAALMGVNVDYVIAVTFMIGSALAAIAGILFAIKVGGNIYFRMGYYPGVIAFAAAVLGGIGSIRGAVVGGLIIGATQAVAQVKWAEYDFAFAFGLMILVILFRPWGIFGKPGAARA
ncbi:MAG: branched-chain amino acid ABC transporter permease [Planctomycetota bacterium]|nr:MAG: branched-chain amino acid ABC transporter permease [Planctomycetota bacterium]